MATLGQYIAWLKSTGGTSKTGMGADPDIGMVPVTKLIAESGRHDRYFSLFRNAANQSLSARYAASDTRSSLQEAPCPDAKTAGEIASPRPPST